MDEESVWMVFEKLPDTAITNYTGNVMLSVDFNKIKTVFAVYVGGLLLLAYILSVFVGYLHIRRDSVVYPLTKPQAGVYFVEYIILVKTSLKFCASFDSRGRVSLQLKGSFADSPFLYLRQGKGIEYFLSRGSVNIFVYHSPYDLGEIQQICIDMVNDAPHEIQNVVWKPCFISVMNVPKSNWWGCSITETLRCSHTLTKLFECKKNLRDSHWFLKSICLFHLWLSMFNSPVRFGMYSNMVNVIIVFMVLSLLISFRMIVLQIIVKTGSEDYGDQNFSLIGKGLIVVVWLFQIIIEAILRNSKPQTSTPRYASYQGLMPPVVSAYGLKDFTVNYDWDKVLPLLPRKKVEMPFGGIHYSTYSAFSVPIYPTFENLWGLYNKEEEREWCVFMRSMNNCALTLPLTMRWLSIEAHGAKEDQLMNMISSNNETNFCVFCTWLIDWPLHYDDEPQQAGLVFSHILSVDILTMVKMNNKTQRARLAQVCVHQWHGMICRLFLTCVKHAVDQRNESFSAIKSFIQRTVKREGKRSAREIQMTWKTRNDRRSKVAQNMLTREFADVTTVTDTTEISPNNTSASCAVVENRANVMKKLGQFLRKGSNERNRCEDSEIGFSSMEERDRVWESEWKEEEEWKSYLQDVLIFDNDTEGDFDQGMLAPAVEAGDGRNRLLTILESAQDNKEMTERLDKGYGNNEIVNGNREIRRRGRNLPGKTHIWDEVETNINQSAVEDKRKEMDKVVRMKIEEKLKEKSGGKDVKEGMLEEQKQVRPEDDVNRMLMPMSNYEKLLPGPPFRNDAVPVPYPEDENLFYRHKLEILNHCCSQRRCRSFKEIHVKVGHSSLEVLKVVMQDLLDFAETSSKESLPRSKMWLRKKMVVNLYNSMNKKAKLYDNNMFQANKGLENEGFMCNQLLTSVYNILEKLIETVQEEKEAKDKAQKEMRIEMYRPTSVTRPLLCSFCARKVKSNYPSQLSCDKEQVLLQFLSRGTIHIAEKELNLEFYSKASIQNYCAMMVNVAKKELLMELEDPPMVLSSKLTRGIIITILDELVPKHTDFREMSAEELRRVGTRRQRIQARHDPVSGNRLKDSMEEKKRKTMINTMKDELGTRWRVMSKENNLHYCAALLAQCLVQERILGFSIYSGFITKEHEQLLESSRNKLREVEMRATTAVLAVARNLMTPLVKEVIDSGPSVDVLFVSNKRETTYFMEALSVAQVLSEPVFLKTCCYYINNIVKKKMEEFLELRFYLKKLNLYTDLSEVPKLSMIKAKYKIYSEPFQPAEIDGHFSIASPILRWGVSAIRGVPPLPKSAKYDEETMSGYENILMEITGTKFANPETEMIVGKMLKTRRTLKTYFDVIHHEGNKSLQTHLAKVQAHLTEQIAASSQSMADAYVLETDYQREFNRDDLFYVEYYATRNMNAIFASVFGYLILFILATMTLLNIVFVSSTASYMELQMVKNWALYSAASFFIHFVILEPLKCILYALFNVYVI